MYQIQTSVKMWVILLMYPMTWTTAYCRPCKGAQPAYRLTTLPLSATKQQPGLTLEVQNATGVLTVGGRQLFSKFLDIIRVNKVEQWVAKPLRLLAHQHAQQNYLLTSVLMWKQTGVSTAFTGCCYVSAQNSLAYTAIYAFTKMSKNSFSFAWLKKP